MTPVNKIHPRFISSLRTWLLASALLVLGACAYGEAPEHVFEKFPLQVVRQQVALSIAIPENGTALSPDDERRLKSFLRDFVQRGRSHMTVETVTPGAARTVLMANGLRANELIMVSDTSIPAPHVALSFTANSVKVPDCGDWSESSAFSPMNRPYSNYGCSARRNIGLTVTDPGDLIQAQPMSGGGAARRDNVIDSFNAGGTAGGDAGGGGEAAADTGAAE